MTSTHVTPWDAVAEADVLRFVNAHPQGLVYYTPAFRRYVLAVAGGECRYRVAVEDGRITGVLPALVCEGPYGAVLNSLPFFGSNGGPLSATPAAAVALRDEWDRLASQVAAATWISHPFTEQPTPSHQLVDERIAQWTDIAGGVEAAQAAIEPSAARNIRKAAAAGIVVRETPDAIGFLADTHRENMAAIGGRTKPAAFFGELGRMEYHRDWRLYVAELGGEPLAALLTFEAARTVEYVMPAVRESARPLQPTALILDAAMRDAAARGFVRWNWGGTWLTQDGVYRFKRKWGARERRYRYYVTLNDRAMLTRTASELSVAYPWYFVVPFGALHS